MRAETLHAIVLVALFLGLGASVYAAYETTNPAATKICSLNSYVSCAAVADSGQTTTAGVPDWLIGIAGYVLMIGIDVPLFLTWKRRLLLALTGISALGILASAYFAYVELFRIQALCPVCLSAYIANIAVFVALLALVREGRSDGGEETTDGGSGRGPTEPPRVASG